MDLNYKVTMNSAIRSDCYLNNPDSLIHANCIYGRKKDTESLVQFKTMWWIQISLLLLRFQNSEQTAWKL